MDNHVQPKQKRTRLVERITSTLEGRASGAVRLSVRLTGTAADAWRGLLGAAQGLNLDDTALITILLDHGSKAVRTALKDIQR